MEPLYGRSGQVYAWLHVQKELIISRGGHALAFITKGHVYDWSGRHLGWWGDGHMRDHHGAVVVITKNATNLIVGTPGFGGSPGVPDINMVGIPGKPGLIGPPGRPDDLGSWAKTMPF